MWIIKPNNMYSTDRFEFEKIFPACDFMRAYTRARKGMGKLEFTMIYEESNEEYIKQESESLCDKSEG